MTDSGEQKTVFISYSSRYRYAAFSVEQFLSTHGYGVYWDDKLEPAKEWLPQLNREIESRDVFVYLLTPESIVSPYCRHEYNQAAKHHKNFVPILLHPDAILPRPIGKVQLIDFTKGSLEEAQDDLLEALENPEGKELREEDRIDDYASAKLLGFIENAFILTVETLDRIHIVASNADHTLSQNLLSRVEKDFDYLVLLAKLIDDQNSQNSRDLTTHIQSISWFLQRGEFKKAIGSAKKAKKKVSARFVDILSR